jgi:hypothetical protein
LIQKERAGWIVAGFVSAARRFDAAQMQVIFDAGGARAVRLARPSSTREWLSLDRMLSATLVREMPLKFRRLMLGMMVMREKENEV